MKNKFNNLIFILVNFFIVVKSVNANEPFIFNITEIEILENGNQVNGFKGGTATSKDGSTITAENFFYNKLTNILETTGNVKYVDKINVKWDKETKLHTFNINFKKPIIDDSRYQKKNGKFIIKKGEDNTDEETEKRSFRKSSFSRFQSRFSRSF